MDKKNLFYLAEDGTNNRVRLESGEPLIVCQEEVTFQEQKNGYPFLRISIEEFERTYEE